MVYADIFPSLLFFLMFKVIYIYALAYYLYIFFLIISYSVVNSLWVQVCPSLRIWVEGTWVAQSIKYCTLDFSQVMLLESQYQGHDLKSWDKPHTGLHDQCVVYLRVSSLPLSLCLLTNMFMFSLKEVKKKKKNL